MKQLSVKLNFLLESCLTPSQNQHMSRIYGVSDTTCKDSRRMPPVFIEIFDNFEHLHSLCSHIELRLSQINRVRGFSLDGTVLVHTLTNQRAAFTSRDHDALSLENHVQNLQNGE